MENILSMIMTVFFSVGLLYNLMVQTIGRENIPPECVQKEGFSENCEDLSKQSRRVYQKYKVAIREQLQRLKTYLEDQISFYIIMADPRDISIPEETRNHYIHLRSLAESILNDTNGVVESFDKDRNSRDVWRSLSRLRNLLNKNRSHFSYTVETRSGKETWTPYHANNDKNVFGSWDDVDIANEPPPTYRGIAKGIGGCGSYLSGDSEAPVFGGSTPRQGIPTDRPRTDN